MAEREALTAEYVRQILDYNFCTGEFRWKARTPETFSENSRSKEWQERAWERRVGKSAGNIDDQGYLKIKISSPAGMRTYGAHRLAWLWMTGEWPKEQIDHINMDKSDNRFANLREATASQNHANRRAYKNGTSKVKGVRWNKSAKKWESRIRKDGVLRYLGVFDDIDDASDAYAKAAANLFGEFARTE